MNDTSGHLPEIPPDPLPAPPPANWRTALADLVGSRINLIQLELKQAAGTGVKRAVFFGATALFLLLGWIFLVAGLVGLISAKGGYPWYFVALIAAGVHLLLAVVFLAIARRPAPPSFEITRQEFKKDREWLNTVQSHGKSSN